MAEEKNLETEAPELVKYLVFRLGEAVYALPAVHIKEIVSDLPCFPVPFTPPWIRGVMNRHGEPYTILDLQALLGGDKTESATHVLLNLPDDQVAIRISEVKEIFKVPSRRLRQLSAGDAQATFFLGSLGLENGEVFVFNLQEILARLARDVHAA